MPIHQSDSNPPELAGGLDAAARWKPFFLMTKLDLIKALETKARMKPMRLSENDASIFLKDESIKHNFHLESLIPIPEKSHSPIFLSLILSPNYYFQTSPL